MNANLIFQLVQVAISLAQSQLDGKDAANVLLTIVQRAGAAYEQQTGKPIDLSLIKSEEPI